MDNVKLEIGIIHLMLPFRLGSQLTQYDNNPEADIWIRTNEDISKLDFLLEHVKAFFSKNVTPAIDEDSACIIMRLRKDSPPVKLFNNKNYLLSNRSFENQEQTKNVLKFIVSFDPNAFRIVFHPSTKVGILLFTVEAVKSSKNIEPQSLADFVRMNYLLRMFNRSTEPYLISQNERPEERSRATMLLTGKNTNIFGKPETSSVELTGWRTGHLVNYLLNGLDEKLKVELFDYNRFTPICYVQPSTEITDDEIVRRALFYFRKVYDFDHSPTYESLHQEREIIHPFKQIYYATSLEGAVVLNNCTTMDSEFLKSFYSNSFQKSVWLYILGILQRTILLQLLKEVSDLDPDDPKIVKEYLKRYTSTSLKAIFSKVSVYHQHNDYYDMIIHNLQINELRSELKDELYELNNLQRQFHQDEVEKNDELEKQYDKRLNIILFVLSVFGLTELIYKVIENTELSIFEHALAFGIPLFMGFTFWKILSMKRK